MKSQERILIVLFFFIALIVYLKIVDVVSPKKYGLIDFPQAKCALSDKTIAALNASAAEITLYDLKPNETLKNINKALLALPHTSQAVKNAILTKSHQYYVFSYFSDGLKVKGYLSVPENASGPIPLIIVLRGGNRLLDLPIPAELSTSAGYAVLATTYRDGVSEGKDEFGGKDVNDVVNLLDNIPLLENTLKVKFHEQNKYIIGVSRGAMQMFLALNRYPELQKKIRKLVSISGLLDLEVDLQNRPDLKKMLMENFGLPKNDKAKNWVAYRNPVQNISHLSKELPIMIAQGNEDPRVCLKEGYDMLQALHDKGHQVTYVEIEGGEHALANSPDFNEVLLDWLAQ